jgi:multiple sugar transport system ATP-binding protein
MATLTIKGVHKRFGPVEVLKGIDIEARDGEFIALVGPSGCGKSTLLAMIAGLETITSGQIFIDERLVNSVAPKDRDIAMVFQSYALYPTMTARQNITFGMESRGVPKAERDEAVRRVAQLLQIEPLLGRKPGQLSGGQRQRVAMGRALVRDPKLFLFDEPLSNLDAKLRVDMRTEIKKLHQRVGKTTIYVTHDQVEAMTLASRIAVMHQGSVQQFDIPQRVYARPANMFVAGFMGSPSMNFLDGRLARDGDGLCVKIPLANGTMAALPLARPPAGVPADGKVVLGIRPEHLYRYDAELRAKKPALARLTAPVELVEPTGAETVANLRIGDREVVGRFDPDGAPEAGEQLDLGIDMAPACLFDPVSQQLIPDASS